MNSINQDVLDRLTSKGLLVKPAPPLGFVPTGSFALNKIISDDYHGGIPIGGITQIIGESSTAKTVFATAILREAQAKGYYTIFIDTENTYSESFAEMIGLDIERLILPDPKEIESLEGAFDTINTYIKEIRTLDTETPIVIAYDSLAVSPIKAEIDAENFESNNMIGAMRAKITGAALRKINPTLRREKVALVIINQIRSKVGVMFGNPDTAAAGGKSLDYYLSVNLQTFSPTGSGKLKDDNKKIIGITGRVKNLKNKVSIPFRECEFKLLYNEGLDELEGLTAYLAEDGLITRSGAWYTDPNGGKFQTKDLTRENITTDEKFSWLKVLLGI